MKQKTSLKITVLAAAALVAIVDNGRLTPSTASAAGEKAANGIRHTAYGAGMGHEASGNGIRQEGGVAVVEFKVVPTPAMIARVSRTPGVKSIRRLDSFKSSYFQRAYQVEFDGAMLEFRRKLLASGDVVRVEGVGHAELTSIIPSPEKNLGSNDPLVGYQWALRSAGQVVLREIDDIRSERIAADPNGPAMDIGLGNIRAKIDASLKRDLIVAVVDSGLDLAHDDINIYHNTAECDGDKLPFKPTVDKDGNGYIGDCMGWNFTAKADAGDNNPDDDLGHGTHLAGILAAKVNNGIGVAGLSDHIKVLPIKVTSRRDNSALTNKVANAILYATKMKADVINFSLGWPVLFDTEYLRQAFSEARKAGIVIVAAAGNNTSAAPVFPCSYEGVICVGSTSLNGEVSGFSNYGGHVDMMAPGEQILSTYPKAKDPEQFSVKGYEIKNGTSQASPYVAGAAALLKGLLPNATVDEIQARLSLSTKPLKWGDKYALAGTIDISRALAATPRSLVQPVYKSVYQVPFKMAAREFKFTLPIKNYWAKAGDVKVSVSLGTKAAALDKTSFALGSLGVGETKAIELTGRILDVDGAREAMLDVALTVDGGAAQPSRQQVVFTRDLTNDADVKSFPIQLSQSTNASKLDLFSIKALREDAAYPDYVHFENVTGGISFTFVRWKNGVFQEETPILLPDAKQILFAWRADLNGDGRGDYIIASVTQKGNDEKTKALQYTLLKDDLSPVFGRQAHLPVVVDGAVIDDDAIKSLSLMPVSSAAGNIAMMTFMTNGNIPKPDLNPDPFEFEVNSSRPRLYYYQPTLENGQWKLATRSYDNSAWEKKIRQSLSLPFRQDVSISALLPQTDDDVRAGRLKALVKIGSSSLKAYRVISINGGNQLLNREYTVTNASFAGQTYEGSEVGSVISLDSEVPQFHAAPAIASFYSSTQGRLSILDGNDPSKLLATQNVQAVRPSDKLLGYVQGFRRGGRTYAFYQSQSQLLVRTTGPGIDARDSAAIDRSSLIPGKVFNAMFFSVARGQSGPKEPAIYVDTTQLSSSRVYLWTLDAQGELLAPMKMNVDIPKNCRAMAPRRWGTHGEWSYVLLCSESQGSWSLKTLPIE